MSTKRKDPNEVKFNAAMRNNDLTRNRLHKRIPDTSDMSYLHRVADEYFDLADKIIKLEKALWRVEDADGSGDLVQVFTPFAKTLKGKDRQLLISQRKAMSVYPDILGKRLMSFKKNIFVPKK